MYLKWPIFAILVTTVMGAKKSTKSLVEPVTDQKEFKKLLRTKNNILVLYSAKESAGDIQGILGDASIEVKGLATILTVNCGDKDGKKLCKKMKVSTTNYVLKHYKDGDFHKDYDRAESLKSLVTFLKDPTGSSAGLVTFLKDPTGSSAGLVTFLKDPTGSSAGLVDFSTVPTGSSAGLVTKN